MAVGKEKETPQKKAQRINALVAAERNKLAAEIPALSAKKRGHAALLLQYCISVVGLEYRHRVWPYEYMAFSRRVGELWEAFCCAAWAYPASRGVTSMETPDFLDVREALRERFIENVGSHPKSAEILSDISALFEIIGEINMKEDQVFTKNGIPYIIDFKSGFGSNEKGNMNRLMTVGRAYRIWDHRSRLLLLVRQEKNNNYLNVLRRSGLWSVHTGNDAYGKIREITGVDIETVRDEVVDWRSDLSRDFYSYLRKQPTDLTAYLRW